MTGQKRPVVDDYARTEPQTAQAAVNIDRVLNLSEDAVWMLQKKILREYFFALQTHFRTLTVSSSAPITASQQHQPQLQQQQPEPPQPHSPTPSSLLLSLPPEIRRHILLHLLSRPSSSPSRGPHPRSLQSPLSLTRTMPPAILRLCQQLYIEGCAVLYSTQEVHIQIDFDIWSHRRGRSDLTVSSTLRDALRYLHVHIFLGNEKRNARPGRKESVARLEVVKKGVRKLGKWLVGPPSLHHSLPVTVRDGKGVEEVEGRRLQMLKINWQEPPQTFTWEQKKSVLDEFRALRPRRVEVGEINWGLNYPGWKFRFEEEYLVQLGQVRDGSGSGSGREEGGPSASTSYETRMEI